MEFLNPGAGYLRVEGELLIRTWTGREADRLPLPPLILGPGGRETAEFAWEEGPPIGLFYLQARLAAEGGQALYYEGPWVVVRPWVPALLGLVLLVRGRVRRRSGGVRR